MDGAMVGIAGGALLFGLLLVVGLVLLTVLAVRLVGGGLAPRHRGRDDASTAPDAATAAPPPALAPAGEGRRLLDERYARGEIDTEEYLQRRRHLGGAG